MAKYLGDISKQTEGVVAQAPDHLMHFNREPLLGPTLSPGTCLVRFEVPGGRLRGARGNRWMLTKRETAHAVFGPELLRTHGRFSIRSIGVAPARVETASISRIVQISGSSRTCAAKRWSRNQVSVPP